MGKIMEYSEAGSGPPAIFLPSIFFRGENYHGVISELAKTYQVYTPTLQFGIKGEAVSKCSDYVKDLREFIKNRKLTNITVVGHSYGGAIALKLAESNKQITKLILIDSAGLPLPYSLKQLVFLLFIKTLHQLRYTGQLSVLYLMLIDFSRLVWGSLPRWSMTIREINRVAHEKQARFEKIRVPALLIWGKTDEIFSLEYAENMKKLLPNSKLVTVDDGHDWLLFRYNELGRLLNL